MINCVPVCASGISRVMPVLMITPICITVLRLMRSDIAEAVNPPTTTSKVGATASQRICSPVSCSGCLGQHQQRAAQRQVVALDEADRAQHQDDHQVVGAERNAVELFAQAQWLAGKPDLPKPKYCSFLSFSQIAKIRKRAPKQPKARPVTRWSCRHHREAILRRCPSLVPYADRSACLRRTFRLSVSRAGCAPASACGLRSRLGLATNRAAPAEPRAQARGPQSFLTGKTLQNSTEHLINPTS